jgi:Protein of unknown function (DUF2800)
VPRHSEIGASSAHRWMKCPGSVRMASGLPQEESRHALEGTLAHTRAYQCLTTGCSPREFLGQREGFLTVTEEMVRSIEIYVDLCRFYMDACDEHWIEQPFTLAKLDPPSDMFGTVDFAALSRKRRELHVLDFKHGRGQWVAAKGNPQPLYYALGAACAIDEPISRVYLTIVQPRFANADPIRTAVVDAAELAEFSFELMARARAALEPGAPTVAGEWCKFCGAKGSCLSFQNARSEAAYHAFELADARAAGARTSGP